MGVHSAKVVQAPNRRLAVLLESEARAAEDADC
jgi:hypothetical protein